MKDDNAHAYVVRYGDKYVESTVAVGGPREVGRTARLSNDAGPQVPLIFTSHDDAQRVADALHGEFRDITYTVQPLVTYAEGVTRMQQALWDAEERVRALEHELQEEQDQHRHDVEKIGRRMINEAEWRGWCDEFDQIMREVDQDLYVKLPVREWPFRVTIPVTVSVRVDVRATDALKAQDSAWEHFTEDEATYIANAVRDRNFDADDRPTWYVEDPG